MLLRGAHGVALERDKMGKRPGRREEGDSRVVPGMRTSARRQGSAGNRDRVEDPLSSGVAGGRADLVSWLQARHPHLAVDEKNPLEYPTVELVRCDHRRGFRVIERVELIDARIMEIKEDGSIVWEYRKLRVRPWWRALYRWVRAFFGSPIPGPGVRHEARCVGPHIATQ